MIVLGDFDAEGIVRARGLIGFGFEPLSEEMEFVFDGVFYWIILREIIRCDV